ncbi:MAG: amidase [Erysipelothrix sp.]|nr:amidase [Erysipelothrix sp.]
MSLKLVIDKLESQEITPKQLVEQSIRLINDKNSDIKAVVNERFEKALVEAESDYSHTKYKGIPILIKSVGHSLANEPSTAASKILKDAVTPYTDNFVKAIQDLGFIIIGQTNAPEFAFKNISDSELYGTVRNPLKMDKTPGGSSGGAAAALLAKFTPVVAASDGGGSIRIPASFSGLVGLKPTRGAIPTGPFSHRGWQGASVNFFITDNVEDSRMLFNDIKKNTIASPFNYIEKEMDATKPLRIAYTDISPIGSEVSDDAKHTVKMTVEALEKMGHTVEYIKPDYDGMQLMKTYYMVNGVETASMIKGIEGMTGQAATIDDIELMSWALYQYGLSVEGYEMVDALNFWDSVSEVLHTFHETYDLFITPTNAKAAPFYDQVYHDEAFIERMKNVENDDDKYQIVWDMFDTPITYTPFTMLANITGQPAISVPMYVNEDGDNFGVQLMAVKGAENFLLDMADQLLDSKK